MSFEHTEAILKSTYQEKEIMKKEIEEFINENWDRIKAKQYLGVFPVHLDLRIHG